MNKNLPSCKPFMCPECQAPHRDKTTLLRSGSSHVFTIPESTNSKCTLRIDNNYFFIFWNLIYNVNYEFISRNFLCFVFIQGRSYQKCLRTSEASKNRNYSFFRPFRPFYPIEAFLVSISEVLALCIPKVNFLQFLTNCLDDFGGFFGEFFRRIFRQMS